MQTARRDPRKILVRGVNWLGDAVMTTPALFRLRERFPSAQVTVLTREKLAPLYQEHPAVDVILPVSAREGVWRTGGRVRVGEFDLGVVFPNSHRSALELWLGRVRWRLGFAVRGRSWMLTRAILPRPGEVRMRKRPVSEVRRLCGEGAEPDPCPPPEAHQLRDYLHLVAALGGNAEALPPQIVVQPEEVASVRTKFGLEPGPTWVGINPGAEYGPAKRWPAERFAAVASRLVAVPGRRILLLGGTGDRELVARVKGGISERGRVKALAGQTSLRELCAVLKCCDVVLTNDTGPMHLAAAVGVPVVVPFGSTSPELTGPGLPGRGRHRILRRPVACSPCFLRECPVDLRCLRSIAVDEVEQALREVLAG